jgi:hypothetical protein
MVHFLVGVRWVAVAVVVVVLWGPPKKGFRKPRASRCGAGFGGGAHGFSNHTVARRQIRKILTRSAKGRRRIRHINRMAPKEALAGEHFCLLGSLALRSASMKAGASLNPMGRRFMQKVSPFQRNANLACRWGGNTAAVSPPAISAEWRRISPESGTISSSCPLSHRGQKINRQRCFAISNTENGVPKIA